MSYFPWTDEMVKEVVRASRSIIYYDHQANSYEQRLHNLIEQYKDDMLPNLIGTFENKLYWAVNKRTLDIRPVNEMVDTDDVYFSNYTDALNFSNEKKKEKTNTSHQRTINS